MKPRILVLTGPTAVGKTELSLRVAEALGGEIVLADSMQLYEKLDIGTAKPTPEETARVPHHLVGVVPIHQAMSVSEYRDLAMEAILDITARGKVPILCGGTGLYIDALTKPCDFSPTGIHEDFRAEMNDLASREGNEAVHKLLMEKDPISAENLHPNNLKRVIRALEVVTFTGKTMSETQADSKSLPAPCDSLIVALNRPREELYERINRRVDIMMEMGLLDEVKALYAEGIQHTPTASQAIGYKELFDYLGGQGDLQAAIDAIKQRSRRYAKRQLTWLRRDDTIYWKDISVFMNPREASQWVLDLWSKHF